MMHRWRTITRYGQTNYLPNTWDPLREHQITSSSPDSEYNPFRQRAALAVMSKLADAYAGSTFARWTDQFRAYDLLLEYDISSAAHAAVVPLTLSLIDASSIPISKLIAFRERRETAKQGVAITARCATDMRMR